MDVIVKDKLINKIKEFLVRWKRTEDWDDFTTNDYNDYMEDAVDLLKEVTTDVDLAEDDE